MFFNNFKNLKIYEKSSRHAGRISVAGALCLFAAAVLLCTGIKAQAASASPNDVHIGSAALSDTFVSGDTVSAVCPVCEDTAAWQPVTNGQAISESGHYYLTEDLSPASTYDISEGMQVCLHLNGNGITASETAGIFSVSGQLTLMGSGAEAETVTYSHTVADSGAVFTVNGGTALLYGGTYTMESKNPVVYMNTPGSTVRVYEGAVIRGNASYAKPPVRVLNGSFYMYGGLVTGGNAMGGNGGNILASSENASVVISGTAKVTDGIANSGGNIALNSGARLSVSEDAQISGGTAEGDAYARGGNIFVGPDAVLEMTGGKLSSGVCKAVQTKHGGGNLHIFTGGTVKLQGGSIEGGRSDMNGGNVFVHQGGKLYMDGGHISGGTALAGGNIYLTVLTSATDTDYRPEFRMTGGTVTGGNATENGGNIGAVGYKSNSTMRPAVSISGGVIGGEPVNKTDAPGYAGNSGGNVFVSYSDATVSETAAITHGQAGKYGGNISVSTQATLTVSGGRIADGHSGRWGGNLYMSATNCSCTITGGLLTGGEAAENGGNAYANHGTLNLQGGTISQGAAAKGANLYLNMGTVTASNTATLSHSPAVASTAPSIEDGDIWITGNAKLGKLSLAAAPIHLGTTASVEVLQSYDSVTSVSVESSMLPAPVCGSSIAGLFAEGPYPGKLFLDTAANRYYLYCADGSTAVYAAAAGALLHDGSYVWYTDNASAVAAWNEDTRALLPAAGEVKLSGGAYRIDLCGQSITVTGSGSVSCTDSANTGYRAAACGRAVFADTVSLSPLCEDNGGYYIAITETDGISFHLLRVEMTGVALRPSCAGIYYTSAFQCDGQLASLITTCGVAVSTVNMPEADFASDGDTLYTELSAAADSQTQTSVMIANIFKTGADNDSRGKTTVYAASYVTLWDGTVLVSKGAAYSVYDILKYINDDTSASQQLLEKAQSFYSAWKDRGIAKWAPALIRIASVEGVPYLHIRAPKEGEAYASFYLYLPAGPGYYTQYRFDYVCKPADPGLSFSSGPNDPANSNLYRINTAYIGTLDGTVFTPSFQALQGGEIAFAFREEGAGDFCGGYHGDELLTELQLLADDMPVDLTKEQFFPFTTFRFEMVSDIYRCNTPDVKLVNHKQCYTVTANTLNLSHEIRWLTDAKPLQAAYVPMLTARRLDPKNQYQILTDTVEFYDAPGGRLVTTFDTTAYGKENGNLFSETVLSNLASTAVRVYGKESGFSAEAGYSVANSSIPDTQLATSLIIRYSSSLDNKVYFNIGKDTQPSAGTVWELNSYYRLTYDPKG